jgi:PTS system nitrogen regulatory IIA component
MAIIVKPEKENKMKDKNSGPLISLKQAASYLGMSKESLYIQARDGKIPCLKIGRIWKFRRSDLDNWVTEEMNNDKNKT